VSVWNNSMRVAYLHRVGVHWGVGPIASLACLFQVTVTNVTKAIKFFFIHAVRRWIIVVHLANEAALMNLIKRSWEFSLSGFWAPLYYDLFEVFSRNFWHNWKEDIELAMYTIETLGVSDIFGNEPTLWTHSGHTTCMYPTWSISLIWRHSLVLTSPNVSLHLLPRNLTPNYPDYPDSPGLPGLPGLPWPPHRISCGPA